MNEALASIHATIEGLSMSAAESDTKLGELERKRDTTLAALRAAYEEEQQALAAARRRELDEVAERRRREDEEREARRRGEDEALAARRAREDEESKGAFDATARGVEDETDGLMDAIEEEAARKMAHGEAKLAELEEKKRELDRLIEEQMKAAVPSIPTRKRARTVRDSGAEPSSPLPPAETLAEHAPGNKGGEEGEEGEEEERGGGEKEDSIPGEGTAERGLEEGDDSRPHPEEPVAEKSVVKEGASTEGSQGQGTQSGEDPGETPPAETASLKDPAKGDTSPREPAAGGHLPAEASEPEAEPEPAPAPAKATNRETAPADVGDSSSVPNTKDHKENVPDEVEETPSEVPGATLAEKNSVSQSEMPETTSRSVTAEEKRVAEEPPAAKPPTEEPASETIPSRDTPAAEEASAIDSLPGAFPEAVETPPLERGVSDDGGKEDLSVEQSATASEPTEIIGEPGEKPPQETTAVEPPEGQEQQTADQKSEALTEPSLVNEDENAPTVVGEQAHGEDADETVGEDSTPGTSTRAVTDAEQAVGEAQPETNDEQPETGDEQAEAHLRDAHDVPHVVFWPVAEETDEKAPSLEEAPLQDEHVTAAGSPVADEPPEKDEAAFQARTQLQDDTAAPEASSAEAVEPRDTSREEKPNELGESPFEETALIQEYNSQGGPAAADAQEDPEDISPLSKETLAPETPVDEVTLEKGPLDADGSPAQDEIPGEDKFEIEEEEEEEEAGPENAMETSASEVLNTREIGVAKAEFAPETPDPDDAAASPAHCVAPALTAEPERAQEEAILTEEASQNAAVDGLSRDMMVGQEKAPSDSAAQVQIDSPEDQVEVSEPAWTFQGEGWPFRNPADGDPDQTHDADGSVLLDSQDEVEQTQRPRSEDDEGQSLSVTAEHQAEETILSRENEKSPPLALAPDESETAEQDTETSATAPFHDETASPLTQVHEEDFSKSREDHYEVTNSISNKETVRTEVDDAQEHEFTISAGDDDVNNNNETSHVEEYHHKHNDDDASSVEENSGEASIVEAYFHPESVSRDNIPANPDAALDSSSMVAEPLSPSMTADQSYGQDRHHDDGFLPRFTIHEHREDGEQLTSRQVLFDEGESNGSSPAQSVGADLHTHRDVDEPARDSYNPFSRMKATSFEQPAYRPSDNIPYNPFALQTVVEEESPQESRNPSAAAGRTAVIDDEDAASEASVSYTNNPFTSSTATTSAAAHNFLRSASALGHSDGQPASPERTFVRSASAQGGRLRGGVSSNNPFARSMKPDEDDDDDDEDQDNDQNRWSTTASATTRGHHEAVARSSNNPFARSTSAKGDSYYEPPDDAETNDTEDTDTDDGEALAAAEATYRNLFPANHGSPGANHGLVSRTPGRDSMYYYNNPFAPRGAGAAGREVDEARFHRGFSSPAAAAAAGGHDYMYSNADPDPDAEAAEEGLDGPTSPIAHHHFVRESSPISERHPAPPPNLLESIQERYNSELEDNVDSDSEGRPETLAPRTSQVVDN
ncbi:hypothetical protein CTA2_10054, partial [Colletotrichum tanaceti]